jgi:hypothetical protein
MNEDFTAEGAEIAEIAEMVFKIEIALRSPRPVR